MGQASGREAALGRERVWGWTNCLPREELGPSTPLREWGAQPPALSLGGQGSWQEPSIHTWANSLAAPGDSARGWRFPQLLYVREGGKNKGQVIHEGGGLMVVENVQDGIKD